MEEPLNTPPEPRSGATVETPAAPPEETASLIESLTAERDKALAEKEELWDRFVRKQAELENFRKRMLREKEEVLQFAAMESIRSLLPVLDDFERALEAPAEGEDYRQGIELIYKRLYDTLVEAGLTPIESVGKKFDPHSHQAVDTVNSEEHKDHTVVEEYRRGYEFKGRLLRPAMVKVAVRE
ncbi:MAG: nucleotide exchange factor GrpE [Acidobacteria bacterium]|nr:nucleotide exchange factor GrpE [Acidobacteriota bacterium]